MSNENVLPLHSPPHNTPTYPPMPHHQQPANGPEPPTARGIACLTVHIPSAFKENTATTNERRSASRWGTPEFKFYYVVAAFAIPTMVWIPISLSLTSHHNYNAFAPKLSEGWIYGHLVDNSDSQYRGFRGNVGILTKAALGYLTLRVIRTRFFTVPSNHRFYQISLNIFLSFVTIIALHGTSAFKVLVILALNYGLAKLGRGRRWAPFATWVVNGLVLFANEMFHGYRFGALNHELAFLDKYSGAYPRWHVNFNITMLRLISFNMDYYWACRNQPTIEENFRPTERQRVTAPHKEELYSIRNYIAYVLYPPLYIAGPIITFNDFIWQHRRPLHIDNRQVIMYLIRLLVCYLTMEYVLHFMYVVAIKDTKAWVGDSPAEIAMIGFWNLIVVWLKLLVPWRFFRAWALLDGIDPPENMVRCMANNYSTFGFWRSWHRSYNLWIIRYIYIPLGGSKNLILNTVLVFSFVALWHDLTFRLLAWGWLVSLFVVPELIATYLLPASKYARYPWYRHICALGAVLNILMMMAANLVGFVVGVDGVKFFAGQLVGTWEGWRFLLAAVACLFVGVQFMFEYREEEGRQGIQRRC